MEAFYVPECKAYLRYMDFPGSGAPCVFLHGFLGSSTGWYAHVAARPPLAGMHTLLVDCLGHGYSDQPGDFGYTVEDHASTLIARVLGTAQFISPRALYREAASLAGTPSPTWRRQLSQLKIPRTYIVGAEEAATERASELAAEGSEIRMVPDVTDRPNFENPDGWPLPLGPRSARFESGSDGTRTRDLRRNR